MSLKDKIIVLLYMMANPVVAALVIIKAASIYSDSADKDSELRVVSISL